MNELKTLKPASVFEYFTKLCSIPHGSGNTHGVALWLCDFAREHSLRYYADEHDNVIIFKEASPGREGVSPVILQGHIDMVCEKTVDSPKDMSSEGIDLIIDGDYLTADGTTLGGDNGIAVAMMLALLASDEYEHPPIEAVFTSDEEIGMIGAGYIDVSSLKGKRMLNLDSEAEGYFTVGCAGGNVTVCQIPLDREDYEGTTYKIDISGLQGGHSGIEIDKGRANANILMSRILCDVSSKTEIRVISVQGGLKDNAIPRSCSAVVCTQNPNILIDSCNRFGVVFANEYKGTDSKICITCTKTDYSTPFDLPSTQKLLCMLSAVPDGVQEMSHDIPGLVQTSLNLGILYTDESGMTAKFCVRSSIESQKNMLCNRLSMITLYLGGNVCIEGDYPAWEYSLNSEVRNLVSTVYKELYGNDPVIETIHAGVECGVFASKIPGLDCVSMGPNLTDIHTPGEKVEISSVQRLWDMIIEILKRLK